MNFSIEVNVIKQKMLEQLWTVDYLVPTYAS